MKKFVSVLLALLLFTVFPLVAFAEEVDYSTVESVLTLAYGDQALEYPLLINSLTGETELPDVTGLYLFITTDSNVLQYLDGDGIVMTWVVNTDTDILAGLDMLIWLFDEVDIVVFYDIAEEEEIVVGSFWGDPLEVPTNSDDFFQEIYDMYLRAF